MYKVMIVDDEPMIINGLQYVINWEEHGLQIAAQAKNGKEALEILHSETINILITDIMMPEMGGLELIKNIRVMDYDIKVIILSGYNEFEYAKEAVRLGIDNYLLKPVIEEELSSTLLSMVDKLDAELSTKNRYIRGLEILRENILNRWIMSNISQAEFTQRAQLIGLDADYNSYLVAVLKACAGKLPAVTEKKAAQHKIFDICRQTMNDEHGKLTFQNFDGDTVVIFAWNDEEYNYDKVRESVKLCVEKIKIDSNCPIMAYMGAVGYNWQSVAKQYERISSVMKLATDNQEHTIIELADNLFVLQEQVLNRQLTDDYSPLVKKAVSYVHKHYAEEISLKTISAHIDVNPAYLGRQFKKETGEMFTNYLNTLRINFAKQMLLNSDFNANEIGIKVGYSNRNYFYNVFKKNVGTYPSEYRTIKKTGK